MTSSEILVNQNGTDDSSEEFSIIGYADEPAFNNALNMSNSGNSGSFTLDDFNARLIELLHENEQLKETLKKNNAVMQEKLGFIEVWHKRMELSKRKQKILLSEANEKIQTLEDENASLQNRIKEHDCTTTIAKKNASVQNSAQVDVAISTHPEASFEIIHVESHELVKKLEDTVRELEEKKKLIELLKKKQSHIEEKSKRFCEQDPEIEKLNKGENTQLEDQETENYKARYLQASEKLQLNELYCKSLENQLKGLQSQLEQRSLDDDHHVANLKAEVKNLASILKIERKANESDRSNFQATQKDLDSLQVEYSKVMQLVATQSKDLKETGHCFDENEAKEKEYLNKIDTLSAQLLDVQMKYEEVQERAASLETNITKAKSDIECVPMLRTELESTKTQLANAATTNADYEKEIIELKNELQVFRAEYAAIIGVSAASEESSSSNHQAEYVEVFTCPICSGTFADSGELENHVNACLDAA